MKKTLLALFSVCMAVLLLKPLTVKAETPTLTIAGVTVTGENKDNVLPGTNSGKVSFNPDTNTLTLDGADIEYNGDVVKANGFDLTICCIGQCKITSTGSSKSAVVLYEGNLKIQGGALSLSGENGILTANGDIVIDNCSIEIKAACAGICQEDALGNKNSEFDGNITIKNCEKVDIRTEESSVIYAGGVRKKNEIGNYAEYSYVKGGNITITGCKSVVIDNYVSENATFFSDALYAAGGVTVKDCPEFNVTTNGNGITSSYGDIRINNSGLKIKALYCGIFRRPIYGYEESEYSGGVYIEKCEKVDIECVLGSSIFAAANWNIEIDAYIKGGDIEITDCNSIKLNQLESGDALEAFGGVTLCNCKEVLINAGCNAISAWHGNITVDNCNLMIKVGDYGIFIESYYADEVSESRGNVLIKNCKKVSIESQDEEAICAYGIVDEHHEYFSDGNVSFANCSEVSLKAGIGEVNPSDAIYANGNVQIDSCTNVIINAYDNGIRSNNDICIENSELQINAGYYGLYSYNSLTVTYSELFVCGAKNAIVCEKDGIDFNGKILLGSTGEYSYEDREQVTSETEIKLKNVFYTAMIGENPALTVYIDDRITAPRLTIEGKSELNHTDIVRYKVSYIGEIPENTTFVWEIAGSGVSFIGENLDTDSVMVFGKGIGNATLTVTLVDSFGRPVETARGEMIEDTLDITVKAESGSILTIIVIVLRVVLGILKGMLL